MITEKPAEPDIIDLQKHNRLPAPQEPPMTEWTRDDLPSVADLVKASVAAMATELGGGADAALDAVVDHLNARHPKPATPQFTDKGHAAIRETLDRLRDEREAAVARAEAAELRCERMEHEIERHSDGARRAQNALVKARPAATVSRADIEKAIQSCRIVRPYADDVMYVAVAEVHETLCRAIEAEAVDPVEALAGQIEAATRTAVREVIDALGKSVDAQAVEDSILATVGDDARWLAAHVLGQEASSDE